MFERFTEGACRAVKLAQEEARRLNHDHLGTEHLLLGLAGQDRDVAARTLESLGISLEAVRQQLGEIADPGQRTSPGHIPFTSRAMMVLELARGEAAALGHDLIGTEHILLGLIGEGTGVGAQVLVDLGADLGRVRQQIIQLVLADALARVNALDRRLAAVERWVGVPADPGDLDQELAQARRDKEAAIERQDFEAAVVARDKEKQLLNTKTARTGPAGGMSLAEELSRVNAELQRLRALVREHGIQPGDDPA